MARTVTDVHSVQNGIDHFFSFGSLDSQIDQRKFHVFVDVQFVDQVEALKHETDLSLAVERPVALLQRTDFLAEQEILARSRIVQQAQNIQQSRFAAARGTHDSDELALLHLERHFVQRDRFDLFRTETFAQFFDF